jgi:predicted nucleic-acid-binding Zn-ribbon protein
VSLDRIQPVTKICIHCGNTDAKLLLSVDLAHYSCSKCGNYSVSSMMQKIIQRGHADPKLARLVVDNGRW